MLFIDTHCHIHEPSYQDAAAAYQRALAAGLDAMLCVGTDRASSQGAVDFAYKHNRAWASIGLHPHEAKNGLSALQCLSEIVTKAKAGPLPSKLVAIGECGLDYFYMHSPKADQIRALRFQIELAVTHKLPLIFHVREAFDDFWPIFDEYPGLKGVIHSFTDTQANAEKALARGLSIGVNGIITFTKLAWQQQVIKQIPLERILLETDAPFLTPVPHRGTVNEPARVLPIAEFLAKLRDESLEDIAATTTRNARQLFPM